LIFKKSTKTKLLCLHYEFIDKDIVKQCHKNGIKINSWTVNEEIDIISSDYPNRVIEILKTKII
jgi:glycerophosphoryl diester phosphodiesterase